MDSTRLRLELLSSFVVALRESRPCGSHGRPPLRAA